MRDATRTHNNVYHYMYFNPRVPCGTRHTDTHDHSQDDIFQSTRPMRDATCESVGCFHPAEISIHASHAGRDLPESELINIKWNFNPRVPCGTRRELRALEGFDFPISIHASHAGRDPQKWVTGLDEDAISIHASHAGRDGNNFSNGLSSGLFQSTRPMRDATICIHKDKLTILISIHASHAGRDGIF